MRYAANILAVMIGVVGIFTAALQLQPQPRHERIISLLLSVGLVLCSLEMVLRAFAH